MDFIDIHIHLQDYKTNFATDIVKKAQTLNYKKLLCAGISEKDWDKVAKWTDLYPDMIVPAFGVHPWQIADISDNWDTLLCSYIEKYPQAIIGETGIDALKENLQQQKQLFVQHIEMAQQYNRPLIIHAVKAVSYFDDLWNKLPEKFMFHSFNGKVEHLKNILSKNGYVSFSASILKNKDFEKIVQNVPVKKILVESDGPYQPFEKGAISTPFFIPELLKYIAKARKCDYEELAYQIYQNSLEFINVR